MSIREGGVMTLANALKVSSNVGVAKAAQALMTPAIQFQTLRDFGLGVPTGVALAGRGQGYLSGARTAGAGSRPSLSPSATKWRSLPFRWRWRTGPWRTEAVSCNPGLFRRFGTPREGPIDRFPPRTVRQVVSP